MTTTLKKVEIAFLFQLADMTVDAEVNAAAYQKAIATYQAAHTLVSARYQNLSSARNADGAPAYRLEAQAALAAPRDGAKVFAVWFSSTEEFSRKAMAELTALCAGCVSDSAYDMGVTSKFAGARQIRTFETVETADIL
jgi:hypothetical protein